LRISGYLFIFLGQIAAKLKLYTSSPLYSPIWLPTAIGIYIQFITSISLVLISGTDARKECRKSNLSLLLDTSSD
jgi:hypothetical protein